MPAPNFADKTIWTGDNLDIMRGMNSESVDLIYLDPPFNSNQNYAAPVGSAAAGAAFKDTWTLSDLDVAWMGLIADEQPATAHVLQTAGLTHGKGMQSYLTMMAVRLMEMRRLLKPTGSIYGSVYLCSPRAVMGTTSKVPRAHPTLPRASTTRTECSRFVATALYLPTILYHPFLSMVNVKGLGQLIGYTRTIQYRTIRETMYGG